MAALVFDLDGTLVDSAPDIQAAANQTLAEYDHPPVSMAQVSAFVGNGVPVFVERLRAHAGLDAPQTEVLARFRGHYDADPSSRTRLFAGVKDALDMLAAQGHLMGLCTNKPVVPARTILQAMGVEGYFAAVIGGDSLAQTKPDPAPLFATLSALGGGAGLFIGDSEVDAATAQAAGVPFALFTEGYRKAAPEHIPHDGRFSNFADLPALVVRLLSTHA